MCGIIGVARFDGAPGAEAWLGAALPCLRHRGPDAQGTWAEAHVALGHARLAIIDLSDEGRQPMVSADGRYVLVFNGEVYNFEALRATVPGHAWRGHSDSEVLLEGFARHGESFIELLDGMFALAIYDRRERRLTLARDPFGIKPLYWHRSPCRLIFASEVAPLLSDGETPRDVDRVALAQVLLFGYSADPRTVFADVERLDPAEILTVEADGRTRRRRYWSLEALMDAPAPEPTAALHDSVRAHLVADVPVGLFLSAGIDSSLLLAEIVGGGLPPGFDAYNVGLEPDAPEDAPGSKLERAVAARAAAHFGAALVRVDPPEGDTLADTVRIVEEPIANPSNALITAVCAAARARGTKVLLSGHGGDEAFAGYRRHVWARHLPRMRHPLGALAARLASALLRDPLARRMADSVHQPLPAALIGLVAPGWDFALRQVGAPGLLDAATREAAFAPLEALLQGWAHHSPLKQLMLLDLRTYLSAQNLVNMDKSSMRHSVEVRVPFVSRAVVASGLQQPDVALVHGRQNKLPLRQIARDRLPEFVLQTPKLGFGRPLGAWLRRPEVRDLVLGPELQQRGLFAAAAVRDVYRRATARDDTSAAALQAYAVAVIEQWHRLFADPPRVGPAPVRDAA